MADTPETLADALAAARAMLDDDSWIDEVTALDEDGEPDDFAQRVVRVNDVRDALDRIEAAAKREREAAQSAPGNSAALRDVVAESTALLAVVSGDGYEENITRQIKRNAAALSAPARNCDRYADCNSAWKAYNAIANRERLPGFDFWLFAPEGGAE